MNEWNNRRKPQIIVKDAAVPHRQLFDWRRASSRELFQEQWEAAAFEGWRPAFLLGAYTEVPPALAPWWPSVPAYRLSEAGGEPFLCANPAAMKQSFEQITDVFLVHCPFPYETFYHILNSYSSIARLYALSLGGEPAVNREVMKRVYVAIRSLPEGSEEDWRRGLAASTGVGPEGVRLSIQVCKELQFIEPGAAAGTWRSVAAPAKRELTESPTFAAARRMEHFGDEWDRSSVAVLRQRLLEHVTEDVVQFKNLMA